MTNSRIKEHPLKSIRGVVNYHGVLVEKLVGGYRLWNKSYTTEKEVDNAINNARKIVSQSIKNKNDGSMNCQSTDR